MITRKQWGILGGTFDPFHHGHLKLGSSALQQCELEKIIFIPAGTPYHRPIEKQPKASGIQRFEMLQCAIQNYPHYIAEDIEIKRNYSSYTYETLCELNRKYPDVDFHLILGIDTFNTIQSWYCYEKLVQDCQFIIAPRDGEKIIDALKHLNVKQLNFEMDISATQIRKLLSQQIYSREYLSIEVIDYIQKNQLYLK